MKTMTPGSSRGLLPTARSRADGAGTAAVRERPQRPHPRRFECRSSRIAVARARVSLAAGIVVLRDRPRAWSALAGIRVEARVSAACDGDARSRRPNRRVGRSNSGTDGAPGCQSGRERRLLGESAQVGPPGTARGVKHGADRLRVVRSGAAQLVDAAGEGVTGLARSSAGRDKWSLGSGLDVQRIERTSSPGAAGTAPSTRARMRRRRRSSPVRRVSVRRRVGVEGGSRLRPRDGASGA